MAETSYDHVGDMHADVVVVGAGFGGLGMGIRLARRGARSFLILERGHDVGGTWRDNTYPGVACDVPSHLYSFSFRLKPDWSHIFASGAQIYQYLRECAHGEGLLPHIRFDTEALDMRWCEQDRQWVIETNTGTYTARILIIAAGRLSDPRIPAIEGIDTFTGRRFHSSAWDHGAQLTGKRVAVIGTGASAIQIVPHVAGQASRLVVFQRSAAYIVPRHDRAYTQGEKRLFARDPQSLHRGRARFFWEAEEAFAQRVALGERIDRLRALALRNLTAQVADSTLRDQLTPDYEIGCKRVLISNDYYPVFARKNVVLETSELVAVHGSRAVAASGRSYDLDVMVFATGFQATQPPYAARIIGRGGMRLRDHWSGGMTAFASTTVHGYPNLFVIDGPNASLGHNSAIYMIETQIEYILGALAFQAEHGDPVLEVSAAAERRYTGDIDEMSRSTVWTNGGCRSWYVDERNGRLVLLWPGFAYSFREENGSFDPSAYETTGVPVIVR